MDIEQQRAKAHTLCNDSGITVLPYGNAWWLRGEGVNQVVGELAGLSLSHLRRFEPISR